jgi:hypothetical protein
MDNMFGNNSTDLAADSMNMNDFVNSNTLIAKISFTLLVMFIFYILLKFSVAYIPKMMNMSNSKKLIDGTLDDNSSLVIPQDPSYKNAITIQRSSNENYGVEFSWSLWLYVNDASIVKSNTGYHHIFHKGDILNHDSIYNIASPGLYIQRNNNVLLFTINSFDKYDNKIEIPNLPINKWLNIIIRCKNKTIDIYINGYIKETIELTKLPKQNDGDVFINQNQQNSFKGKISNLWYYEKALNIFDIKQINLKGPNLNMVASDTSGLLNPQHDYIGFDWYYQ